MDSIGRVSPSGVQHVTWLFQCSIEFYLLSLKMKSNSWRYSKALKFIIVIELRAVLVTSVPRRTIRPISTCKQWPSFPDWRTQAEPLSVLFAIVSPSLQRLSKSIFSFSTNLVSVTIYPLLTNRNVVPRRRQWTQQRNCNRLFSFKLRLFYWNI